MCTSLLPLAWSARSPCRVLVSREALSGFTPPPADRISPRFLRSASLNGDRSMVDSRARGRRTAAWRRPPAPLPPKEKCNLTVAADQVADAAQHAAQVALHILP